MAPPSSDNRSIGCREQSPHSGHLPPLLSPLPDWAFTRSAVVPHALPPPSLPRAFSHIILGQLLGIPSSSADVTGSIWPRWLRVMRRGSPGFGRSSAAISEIAAAAAFLSSQPAVGLLINVSFALNIRPCTPARPKPLLLSVVAGPQKEGSSRNCFCSCSSPHPL